MDEDTVARRILDACADQMPPGRVAPLMWHRRAAKAIMRDHRRGVWIQIAICNAGWIILTLAFAWARSRGY